MRGPCHPHYQQIDLHQQLMQAIALHWERLAQGKTLSLSLCMQLVAKNHEEATKKIRQYFQILEESMKAFKPIKVQNVPFWQQETKMAGMAWHTGGHVYAGGGEMAVRQEDAMAFLKRHKQWKEQMELGQVVQSDRPIASCMKL